MKLDTEIFLNKINTLWKNKNCPICGNVHWGIDNRIVTPLNVDENKSINIGGRFNPLVPITCDTCGYTIFINALKLGALTMDNEENENGDSNG